MTTSEMLYRFNEINDTVSKLHGLEVRDVDTETILHYLNIAQNKLFRERYLSKGIDSTVKISKLADELGSLLTTETATIEGDSTAYPKGKILQLPEDCALPIKISVTGTHQMLGETPGIFTADITDFSEINKYITTGFNIPIILRPKYVVSYGGAEIDFQSEEISLIFEWSDTVDIQTTETNDYKIIFEWSDLVNVQSNEVEKFKIIFEWLDLIPVQTDEVERFKITFEWLDLVNIQTDEISSFKIEWSDLIPVQVITFTPFTTKSSSEGQ